MTLQGGVPVLVLDGHTTQALACVRSLGRAGYPVFVASDRRWPLAGWSRHSRETWRLAGETIPEFAALRRRAAERGIGVVLPLTERSCLLCNAEAAAWSAAGITLGCGPTEMLLNAFDKERALLRAAACGIAIPPTRFPTSWSEYPAAARDVGYPCVVKTRFSHAWDEGRFLADPGVAYVANPKELERAVHPRRQGHRWPMVQRWVPGVGKGLFALCDKGRVVSWFAHVRLRDVRPSGSGSSLRRSTPVDPRLVKPAARLLAELKWHGPVMLEFRDDGEGDPLLMEINGRFWGSLQLAISAGADLPVWWVGMLAGARPLLPLSYRSGITLRWLWGDVKRLLYIAQGPPASYPGSYPRLRDGLREVLGRQPAGARSETWDRSDPWPAAGEWVQGFLELLARWRGRSTAPTAVAAPPSPGERPAAA